jgi:ribonuclease BN (tRNA processing enzyme)
MSYAKYLSYSAVERVFITHLHGDHLFGLPGLLSSALSPYMSTSSKIVMPSLHQPTQNELCTSSPTVHIYGPRGISKFLGNTFGLVEPLATEAEGASVGLPVEQKLRGRFIVHEILRPGQPPSVPPKAYSPLGHFTVEHCRPDGTFLVHEDEGYIVHAAFIRHTAACLGYAVTEKDKVGPIDVDKV